MQQIHKCSKLLAGMDLPTLLTFVCNLVSSFRYRCCIAGLFIKMFVLAISNSPLLWAISISSADLNSLGVALSSQLTKFRCTIGLYWNHTYTHEVNNERIGSWCERIESGLLAGLDLRIFWSILNHNHSIIFYDKYDKQNPLKKFNLCP